MRDRLLPMARTLFPGFLLLAGLPVFPAFAEGPVPPGPVMVLTIDGTINPVTSEYLSRELDLARGKAASLLVLRLDTPGGLLSSTRDMVKAILASPVPVAVYVSPPGARAASAGLFITLASHAAAMAPGTNIGAAHPVMTGTFPGKGRKEPGKDGEPGAPADDDVMGEKVLNDTVAYVKTLARQRGRNEGWAERAVRESVSATETEALRLGVVDLVAADLPALLASLQGRKVSTAGGDRVLALSGASIEERPMGWILRFLAALADPNLAFILLALGALGLYFEFANPGVILPGALGAIFLLLAAFSFQMLPVNIVGVFFLLLAMVLFILEIKVVSFGMLSVGGVVSLVLGSLMLFDSTEPFLRISTGLIVWVAVLVGLFILLVSLGVVARDFRRKPVTGMEGLLEATGTADTDLAPEGTVTVQGEIWKAQAEEPIPAGAKVRVTGVDGLTLRVARLPAQNKEN